MRLLTAPVHYILFLCVHATVPSPKAFAELICHTDHASECYTRIFQPTREFQTIHDDQNLPPGLHVRMNLATGVKEARLNVPQSGADEISSGLTVIEDPDTLGHGSARADDYTIDREDVPSQQPIRSPPYNLAENFVFSDSVSAVKSHNFADTDQLSAALNELEDLAHSYQWGLALAKDVDLSHRLYQLLLPSQPSEEIRSLTALVFGTAIRNNPEALSAALSHFYSDDWPEGLLEAIIVALLHEEAPALLSRMMYLLSSLCQDEGQLKRFLDARGIEILTRVYGVKSANADDMYRLKTKVSHFFVDHLRRPTSENVNEQEGFLKETELNAGWLAKTANME
ncbi:MAG: hypothetical protein LQ343_000028 [Gyalolechia ehrenbergii]|nr:MAG: hypothetical protein LQ343_000028 [Gyalolechia ehrenbergii]